MAPTIPPSFGSSRRRCSSAAITVSSSSSDTSDLPAAHDAVVVLATSSPRSVIVLPDSSTSRDDGEKRRAPLNRRLTKQAPSTPVRVVTAASFAVGGGGDEATSERTAAARNRSSSAVLDSGGGVAPATPARGEGTEGTSRGGGEATSQPKRKPRYRKWDVDDEVKILETMAEFSRKNFGVLPQASVLLKKLKRRGGLRRRGVDSVELSSKVSKLKKKFEKTAVRVAANVRGRRRPKYRDQKLYEVSMEVWPDLLSEVVAAVRRAKAERRRRRRRRVHVV